MVHRGYVPIDAALLRQLYVNDALSTDKIAARLGCTATTIRRRLRRFGIEIRPRGPVSLMRSRPVALTPAAAYAVGLATTDGNLSSDRRHMSFVSASRPFVEWIQTAVNRVAQVSGSIQESKRQGAEPIWELRYAKAESIRLIRWMYHSPDVPCLQRKRAKAERFLSPLGYISVRSVGRPRVGWLYNDEAAR